MMHLTRAGYFADERLPLELIRREPQVPFPLHTHEFSELVVVLSGSGTHFTETEEYTVGAGDAFVVDGSRAHGYRNVKELLLVNILFDPARLRIPEADLLGIPGYRAPVAPGPRSAAADRGRRRLGAAQLARAEELIDALERECRDRRAGYHSLAAAYFMQIIGYLARCFTEPQRSQPTSRVAEAMGYVERNLARRLRMGDLVALTRMSESSLLRAFKKAVGMSPFQYQRHLKIERACRLLSRPELSITEVSYRSGFSDSNYFSRQFRKRKRRSPRQYRRELSEDADRPSGNGGRPGDAARPRTDSGGRHEGAERA